MTIHKAIDQRDDVDWLYVSGKRLSSINDCVDTSTKEFRNYNKGNKKD